MLIPRNRLLFWFTVIVLPFSFLGAVEPAAFLFSVAAIGLFFILLFVDGLSTRFVMAGVSIEVPAVARLSKGREGQLEVRIQNGSRKPRVVSLALGLPREIPSAQEQVQLALPPDSEWSRFGWRCLPSKRGQYWVSAAYLQASSPLQFWSIRKRFALRSEIRVYPNLLTDRKELAALFLHRASYGLHSQRQLGKGREFEKLREYVPGDSFDEIHWKATARRGHPITKVFQIERTQEIYIIIDASRLSARAAPTARLPLTASPKAALADATTAGPGPDPDASKEATVASTSTLERFITAGLVLGLAAQQQGDLFGLLTFSKQVDRFVRASSGKAHYSACRDALYLLEPQVVSPDYDELCTFIRLRLRRRALLLFLTSLDDAMLAESFVRNMELIRRQHVVLVSMLHPPGIGPLFSDPNVVSTDDLYNHLAGHFRWQTLRELQKVLQRRGVGFSLLKNERLGAELVSQYLNIKRRQML